MQNFTAVTAFEGNVPLRREGFLRIPLYRIFIHFAANNMFFLFSRAYAII